MFKIQTVGEIVREKLAGAARRVDQEIVNPEPPPISDLQKEAGAIEDVDGQELLKIASQCDYVAHVLKMGTGDGSTNSAEFTSDQGPGRSAGALEMQTPTSQEGIPVEGTSQEHKTPDKPQMEAKGAPKENPDTVFKTDYTEPPGVGEGMGPVGADGSTLTPADTAVKSAAWADRVRSILAKKAAEVTGGGFQESTAGPGKGPGSMDTNQKEDPQIPPEGQVVQDTQKVIDVTQRETKAPVKDELKDFVKEPALSKKTDPVASDMFDHAEEAGVKVSAVETEIARAYLRKVAGRGCTCGGAGTCGYCNYTEYMQKVSEGNPEPAINY